jgi:hypothetical protein
MATFRFSSSGLPGTLPSIITNTGAAFADDNPGPDTLIIDSGAFIITTDTGIAGVGVGLLATGAWTVTVNGFIGAGNVGLFLAGGNSATSTFTIGADGSVSGDGNYGLDVESAAKIVNRGKIFGGDVGIIHIGGDVSENFVNTGTITGVNLSILTQGNGQDTVTNSGTLNGATNLGGGNDKLTNSGFINGDNDLGLGKETI